MSLILWTGADASKVKTVIGPILSRGSVPHVFETDMTKVPTVGTGDVLLAFGAKSLLLLQSLKVVPKGRKVTSIREQAIPYQNGTLFVTFDPGLALMDYARLPEIQWDIQLAMRMHETGSTRPETGVYREVESLHEMIERVEQKFARTGTPVDVSCDIETLGLDEYNPEAWIISCSFTVDSGKSDVLYFTRDERPVEPMPWDDPETLTYWQALWVQIHWLLTTEKVSIRGANFKYDSRWLTQKWAIYCTNHKFDTLLVGSLLDENRSNSLKLHVKLFTIMGGYEDDMDKYDMGRLDLVPKEEIVFYNGGDTDGTQRVADIMRRDLLRDGRLTNFYVKLMHPASKVFEKMERNGIVIDRPYMDQLQGELRVEITRLSYEMVKCLPNKLRIKYKDSIAESISDGKSPLKPAMLKEFLFSTNGLNLKPQIFTEKTGEPSTSMDHLMMFQDDPIATNFIGHFKEYGSAAKTLSTFVTGFMKHMRSDGRFHPTYLLFRGGYGEDDDDSGTNCLLGSSRILTPHGLVPADSITEGTLVFTHRGRWRPVSYSVSNGTKPVLSLSVGSFTLFCTANHPILTTTGWVFAEDIQPGFHQVICYTGSGHLFRNHHGDLETDPELSRIPYIESGKATNGQSTEKPLTRNSTRFRGGTRVQVLHSEESGREEAFSGSPLSCIGVSPSPIRGADTGTPSGRCALELCVEELTVGDPSGEQSGHRVSRKDYCWREESLFQAGSGTGLSYKERLGYSLWKRNGKEAPPCGSDYIQNQEWKSLGFEAVVVSAVNFIGDHETFDITVEEDHSFVVEGIVTHNTGRTSAKAPAVQTISKHSKWAKRLRRAYIAPPGKTILQLDYSQGELRITAVIAEEPKMIEAYKQGKDLHAITAAELNGYTFEDFMLLPEDKRDELRSGGKAGNFGLIYGMMPPGFKEYAYLTYGVYMTLEEAVVKRTAFFDLYDMLPKWHESYRAMAHKNMFVRSPLGRIRHLPLINSKDHSIRAQAERQCINSPVQSCLSDMMQLAMVLIDREYGEEDIEMFLMTHDSLALYIPEADGALWAQRLKVIMDNLPLAKEFGFNSPLNFPVDAELAVPDSDGVPSLATLKKLKGLK